MSVLIGFANAEDGGLALRRSTEPPTVPLDPKSVGAPPTSAEVAEEVGRPHVTVVREPPPPPAGGGARAALRAPRAGGGGVADRGGRHAGQQPRGWPCKGPR